MVGELRSCANNAMPFQIPSCSIDFWSIVQSATVVPIALAHCSH